MNYEQKYKEALAKARVVNPGTKDYNIVTAIFPELKESEDERIRKEIIYYLDREITLSNSGGDTATFKRWIAWLEKQGEQKQEWSSKDEDIFTNLWGMLRNNYVPPKNAEEYIKWLQSLKQRLNGYE